MQFLLTSKALCPLKGQIYHSNIFKGFRICISMTSVGLINPFEKFRKVLIFFFFTEFLELCSNAFALVPPFKDLQRFTNRGCSRKGIVPSLGSQFGSAVDATKWTSGLEDPSYKGRFKLKIQLKSEKPRWLIICISSPI